MIFCLYASLLIWIANTSCSDQLSCFKTKLFNFGSASENIYLINQITNDNLAKQLNILGYGDFNNDLHTDFIAQGSDRYSISIYNWNSTESLFVYNQALDTTDCPASSVFLYDMDLNGILDVLVWGSINNQNCILPYIQQSDRSFMKATLVSLQPTSNPYIVSFGTNNGQKTLCLAVFQNGSRVLLKYESTTKNFTVINWSNIFLGSAALSSLSFNQPHWNSYLDITGDCQGDTVIYNSQGNLQFWVSQGDNTFKLWNTMAYPGITAFSFADMNYDGLIDFVVAWPNLIRIYFNAATVNQDYQFCKSNQKNINFNFNDKFVSISLPEGWSMQPSNLQIKDINIDGFPDIMVTLHSSSQGSVRIYISDQAKSYAENDQYKLPTSVFSGLISASFIDFWENGIIDIVVCTKQNGLLSFYNNYLQQNLFFIKGYAASGNTASMSAQIVGASFYWVNSVGDGYRATYQPQIFQTAYNALQTPYSYCGLGRSNSYVESFTLGIYGSSNSWSPIIPNSQLAVYTQGAQPQQWVIKIFVLPTQSLIYVVIVSVVVLSVLGLVLLVLKFRNFKKKDQPMMQFIH